MSKDTQSPPTGIRGEIPRRKRRPSFESGASRTVLSSKGCFAAPTPGAPLLLPRRSAPHSNRDGRLRRELSPESLAAWPQRTFGPAMTAK